SACRSFRSRSRPAPGCGRCWDRSASCRAPRMSLRSRVEALGAAARDRYDEADRALFAEFRAALTRGEIRAAERRPDGAWCVNAWVKPGILPGGSSIRDGAYVAAGVICMPPMYVNVGAYVDAGTMIDSHALVGSCAQIGRRVHLSAAAQIGGVLEPVGALPVIVEDDVLVGGGCGIYEG